MFPISTIKMVNDKIEYCESKLKDEPKKYTFMYESLKQVRAMILLEHLVINRVKLN